MNEEYETSEDVETVNPEVAKQCASTEGLEIANFPPYDHRRIAALNHAISIRTSADNDKIIDDAQAFYNFLSQ